MTDTSGAELIAATDDEVMRLRQMAERTKRGHTVPVTRVEMLGLCDSLVLARNERDELAAEIDRLRRAGGGA